MELNIVKLGLIEYRPALDFQIELQKLRQQGSIGDVLLLLEHPSVITVGRGGKDTNILVTEEFLDRTGVMVYHTNRGGDVTYHGPGQLVGYPIFHLNNHGKDVQSYIRMLEETFIQLLKEDYGVAAGRNCRYHGVWVGNDKITALGCSVRRWVTMHGFALNVNTNLEHFKWINPCGITDRGVTSIEKLLGSPQPMEVVIQQVIKHFSAVFQMEAEIVEKETYLRRIKGLSNG